MMGTLLWSAALLAAAIYCLVRGIVDLRHKHYAWGVAGILSAGAILLVPIQTHAVKLDLPVEVQH